MSFQRQSYIDVYCDADACEVELFDDSETRYDFAPDTKDDLLRYGWRCLPDGRHLCPTHSRDELE